jgi:hypothetical protein
MRPHAWGAGLAATLVAACALYGLVDRALAEAIAVSRWHVALRRLMLVIVALPLIWFGLWLFEAALGGRWH